MIFNWFNSVPKNTLYPKIQRNLFDIVLTTRLGERTRLKSWFRLIKDSDKDSPGINICIITIIIIAIYVMNCVVGVSRNIARLLPLHHHIRLRLGAKTQQNSHGLPNYISNKQVSQSWRSCFAKLQNCLSSSSIHTAFCFLTWNWTRFATFQLRVPGIELIICCSLHKRLVKQ